MIIEPRTNLGGTRRFFPLLCDGVGARDAQTCWTNPAGMTCLESKEIMLSFQPLNLNFEFRPAETTEVSGSSGGNQGGRVPGGALYFAAQVNDKTALGLRVTSPSGLVLDPEDDWVGQYYMTKTQLVDHKHSF